MRLLIFTQKVDRNDTVLGFFYNWIISLSERYDTITVICLEKNISELHTDLPKNVTVYSLGKEDSSRPHSKIRYLFRLYSYMYMLRGTYDSVFVHMNQEYVLALGLYWKMKNIPVFLWRNHQYGNILTRLAVLLSTRVFCTSKASFTARYKKSVLMPVGIDATLYTQTSRGMRKKFSVCMVGRISPVKRIHLALEAQTELVRRGGKVSLYIIGSPTVHDTEYYNSLIEYVSKNDLARYVQFLPAVPPNMLPEVYSSYEICLNLTPDGSFDKTIIEAPACGAIPLVTNTSLSGILPDVCITEPNSISISDSIERLCDATVQVTIRKSLEEVVEKNTLSRLIDQLIVYMSPTINT